MSSIATRLALLLSAFSPSVRALSMSTSAKASSASGWSDVAIKAAKDFTISQREKLQEMGALDIQRPMKIIGEPVDTPESNLYADSNTKIIHFQRHGQGYHNFICDLWREWDQPIDFDSADPQLNPVVRSELLDPPLTHRGVQQCKERRLQCSQLNPQVVIVSPLLRCLQTAQLSFADHIDTAKWVSHEGCREELGLLVGNKRRPLTDIKEDYPKIDFSGIPYEQDELWESYGDRRETLLEKSERIYDFLVNYVAERPEPEIAVVCHSAYLFTLLNAVMDIEEEDLRSWFLTSEVRSLKMTIVANDKYGED